MDISEAVDQRKSIRAFKPDPVSLDTLKKILEEAIRAPSWANTQPWEFAVATGKPLEEIRALFLEKSLRDMLREYVSWINKTGWLLKRIGIHDKSRISGILEPRR
jgi:nitroreductase